MIRNRHRGRVHLCQGFAEPQVPSPALSRMNLSGKDFDRSLEFGFPRFGQVVNTGEAQTATTVRRTTRTQQVETCR